jgi:hypothetical protein
MENSTVDNKIDNRFELLKELLLQEDRKDFKVLKQEILHTRNLKKKFLR